MEFRETRFELKADSVDEPKGEFTGLASVYDNVDLGGDVVKAGAFSKTIKDNGGEVPILWAHDTREPLGVARVEESKDGLLVHGKLDLDVPQARAAFKLMRPFEGFKRAAVRGMSFGYDTIKHAFEGSNRLLQEVKLWEVSLVVFGMNPKALIRTVKDASPDPRVAELEAKIVELHGRLIEQESTLSALIESKIQEFRTTLTEQGLLDEPETLHSLRHLLDVGAGLNNVESQGKSFDDPDDKHSACVLLQDLQTYLSEKVHGNE
jgi:uncharacterized protein